MVYASESIETQLAQSKRGANLETYSVSKIQDESIGGIQEILDKSSLKFGVKDGVLSFDGESEADYKRKQDYQLEMLNIHKNINAGQNSLLRREHMKPAGKALTDSRRYYLDARVAQLTSKFRSSISGIAFAAANFSRNKQVEEESTES